MPTDLLLSSGFLAFARHAGVLEAVEQEGVEVDAIVGTSSGALVGALWASGMRAERVTEEIAARRPLSLMALHLLPWRGLFRLDPLVRWLAQHLPPRIEDLPRPFAVGVIDGARRPLLLTRGPLPEAVAASCAIPHVFHPVEIEGETYADGGFADRLMYAPWRAWRGERPVLAHLVDRSKGVDPTDDLSQVPVIRTPRSGASFWSLGDVHAQKEEARLRAVERLRG